MATPVVTASNPTPTSTGVEGAMDVDVSVEIDGKTFKGSVTLINEYGSWSGFESPDSWMSQPLLDAVEAAEDPQALMMEVSGEAAAEIDAAA